MKEIVVCGLEVNVLTVFHFWPTTYLWTYKLETAHGEQVHIPE